jgi:medium-chain acyl-[acyl-carrier-protein] hydrolase
MKSIWETSLNIRAFDVDTNNRLKINSIFDYFQDAASNHADELKVGYDDLIPRGLFWILSWAKFEFNSYPKFKDEIKIQTWGKKQNKLYSMRDVIFYNCDEDIICKGTTAWLLLDAKTMRPKILTSLFPEVKLLEDKSAMDDLPEKLVNDQKAKKIFSKKMKYSDIDLNKHVNNAKYVEQFLDCYEQEFHNINQIKSLTISFLSETKYGDTIEVLKNSIESEEKKHFVEAKNLTTGKDVFRSIVEWN